MLAFVITLVLTSIEVLTSIGNYIKLHSFGIYFNSPKQAKTDASLIPSKIPTITGKVLALLLK